MNFIRWALRRLLWSVAVIALVVVSVRLGVEVHRDWSERRNTDGLVTIQFAGKWRGLASAKSAGPSHREIVDEEIQAALDQMRGKSPSTPMEQARLVIEDGEVTFEKLNDQGEVIRTTPVSDMSTVVEEEPTLFVDTRDRPPPPDPQELADYADAVAAAKAFWWQRRRLLRWRQVQEVVDAKSSQLQELEPDQMVHLLSKTIDVPEDVVWKNYEQALWIAKLIATRDGMPDDGLSDHSLRLDEEWQRVMYPNRIKWSQAGLVALGLSIFTGALGYLSIMLTAGPRSRSASASG